MLKDINKGVEWISPKGQRVTFQVRTYKNVCDSIPDRVQVRPDYHYDNEYYWAYTNDGSSWEVIKNQSEALKITRSDDQTFDDCLDLVINKLGMLNTVK